MWKHDVQTEIFKIAQREEREIYDKNTQRSLVLGDVFLIRGFLSMFRNT